MASTVVNDTHGRALDFGLNIITEYVSHPFDENAYESGNDTKFHIKKYSDSAIIIQSILKFSLKLSINEYFTSSGLTEHLVQPLQSKCEFFNKLYSGSKSKTHQGARVAENIEIINNILEKLTYLELVEILIDPNQAKSYKFTRLGMMIGSLLLYNQDKSEYKRECFTRVIDFYNSINYSSAKFISIFLARCDDSIVFDQMIDKITKLLEDAPPKKDLSIYNLSNINPILTRESWKFLEEAFIEFDNIDPLKYEILFYHLKLNLERIHENKSRNFSGLEEFRFLIRHYPFFAAMEGYCKNCNTYTPTSTPIIHYFRSYTNYEDGKRYNHMNVKCPNTSCQNGFLDFEFITEFQMIKNVDNQTRRNEKFLVSITESHINTFATIFARHNNGSGEFTIQSQRYQAILELLVNNPQRYYRIREIISKVRETGRLNHKKTKTEKSNMSPVENYQYAFGSYLNLFVFLHIAVIRDVPGSKTTKTVQGYQLTPFGQSIALLAKYQSGNTDKSLYEEIFHNWLSNVLMPPVSSLDLFAKEYLFYCKESDLFEKLVKFYCDYLLSNPLIYNKIDLFTRLVLFRTLDKETNLRVWEWWEKAYQQLNEHTQNLFLFHIKMFVHNIMKSSAISYSKYEETLYEIKNNHKMLVVEYQCYNCNNNFYLYKPVQILTYVQYLFGVVTDIIYNMNKIIKCSYCNGKISVVSI